LLIDQHRLICEGFDFLKEQKISEAVGILHKVVEGPKEQLITEPRPQTLAKELETLKLEQETDRKRTTRIVTDYQVEIQKLQKQLLNLPRDL